MQRLKSMFADTVFVCLYVVISNGVFGVDSNEVKSVSVMEGDSVTLHTDITDIQTDDLILWQFVPRGNRIAEIKKKGSPIYNDDADGRFKDKLKLNSQTGSLTITNISITNSGIYKLQIAKKTNISDKRFNVTVYARLPVPVIISYCPQNPPSSERSSVSKCALLCLVMNVTHVSLSWYKGNSLLSSISVSDLNIRLSLPLEVEYQDNNTYRCVINNAITNHTQHLDINELCRTCSELKPACTVLALMLFVLVLICGICFYWRTRGSRAPVEQDNSDCTKEEKYP